MKALASVLLLLSLPAPRVILPPRVPVDHAIPQQARKGGRWYLAESGHAVYCYGPVLMLTDAQGGLQRVATFCQGEKVMVPLKD
ncbi:MAG TPA: hypothetical protein VMT28_07830 [Terriglobales bacterium]|nr:hypothetical protein [Terriglobales bacterium]